MTRFTGYPTTTDDDLVDFNHRTGNVHTALPSVTRERAEPVGKIRIRDLHPLDAADITHILASIVRGPTAIDHARSSKDTFETKTISGLWPNLTARVIGFMISAIRNFGLGIETSAWIAAFGIEPGLTGHGIGDWPAHEMFARCKQMGVGRIYTTIQWDSTDLLTFFKTLGFNRSNHINLKKTL